MTRRLSFLAAVVVLSLSAQTRHTPAQGNTDTVHLPSGGNLQAAVTRMAKTGGRITLDAGGSYTGPITFPKRPEGSPVVTITTKGSLPERRLGEADRPLLATINATNADGALRFENTSGYRIDGVALTMPVPTHEVAVIQDSDHITLDRLLFVSPSGQKRVVRGNGRHITLTRSYLDGGAWPGQDSQAFCAWEGAGPYSITNNLLAASGENIMFGGADNYLHAGADNPADILIEGNHVYKPLAWKSKPGTVKNLIELKNATRVIVRNNIFENNWTDAQPGWSFVITPVNQDSRAPWTAVKDVLIERNVFIGVERGFNIIGKAYAHVTQQTSGIVIRKNVFESPGQFLQAASEVKDLTIEDNVILTRYNVLTFYVGGVRDAQGGPMRDSQVAVERFVFRNNIGRWTGYGYHSEVGLGLAALKGRTGSFVHEGNRLVKAAPDANHAFPAGAQEITEDQLQAAKAALLKELGR